MSTQHEVFRDEPVCRHSGIYYEPAGGHDMTCLRLNVPGTFFCHAKCEHYEPLIKESEEYCEGDMCEFGQVIRNARQKKHITQRELAKRIGVDFSYISKIETGALEPPSEEVIKSMCDVLGLDYIDTMIEARKIPTEITKLILNNKSVVEYLRQFIG